MLRIVRSSLSLLRLSFLLCSLPVHAWAQPPAGHDHTAMQQGTWRLTHDGVVFLTFNHQGGSRGGDELAVQNWWMGMAERRIGSGSVRFTVMLSLEPALMGKDGYREIFQAGETVDGRPLIDHQHPHDFLMQAAVSWQANVGKGYRLTLSGAPVGEPAIGPVAFMHRPSASENPTAPLGHHTLDSTHIAMGVLTAGLARGKWEVESSLFRGREPDEQRWDLMDVGPLDSWAVRGWYRPTPEWSIQVSHAYLEEPEASESGDVRRTTASASWIRQRHAGWTAATIAYGRNNELGGDFNAFLAEATHAFGSNTAYGRFESLQVESNLLWLGVHGSVGGGKADRHVPDTGEGRDLLSAVTLGGTRTIARPFGWDAAAGADVTFHATPSILKPIYDGNPISFHVFFRVRPPGPRMDHR